ncbi:hypothetical protein NDU88_002894 [Pleurodeles waltl]|uniref:Uncharacterized protein n=1 Tax=Pleurodeles waltl TaxID=8319 RepID=A0AAV7M2T7_PLEWA|nr:hypothetical protein NDU88_002894 [Pleurodeles waltl]
MLSMLAILVEVDGRDWAHGRTSLDKSRAPPTAQGPESAKAMLNTSPVVRAAKVAAAVEVQVDCNWGRYQNPDQMKSSAVPLVARRGFALHPGCCGICMRGFSLGSPLRTSEAPHSP